MVILSQILSNLMSFERKENITDIFIALNLKGRLASKFMERAWYVRGTTSEILAYGDAVRVTEKNLRCFGADFWLQRVCSLLKTGRDEEARELLKQVVVVHGKTGVPLFFPAARLADRSGWGNDDIHSSAEIFERIEQNRSKQLFENTLRGKTVALVGNGPSEIGKGNGKRIDAHDCVVRYNNFKIDGFERDYGRKTSIWVIAFAAESNDVVYDHPNIFEDTLVVLRPDLWHTRVTKTMRKQLAALLTKTKTIDYFCSDIHSSFRQTSTIWPSAGLLTLWAVCRHRLAQITADDLFGFSFLQTVQKKYAEHYFEISGDETVRDRKYHSKDHRFEQESEWIMKLFDGKIAAGGLPFQESDSGEPS